MYFCHACDERLESGSWLTWFELRLHFGVTTWRGMERLADRLAGRLRWLLFMETRQEEARHYWFEEAACWAGNSARAVMERLALFEKQRGKHGGGRPRIEVTSGRRKVREKSQ